MMEQENIVEVPSTNDGEEFFNFLHSTIECINIACRFK